MDKRKEFRILAWIVVGFAAMFFMPISSERFITAVYATLDLTKWYAQEHVVMCLLPAFFIAGVIAVFVSQGAVLKYFGANAKKWLSYTVTSVSLPNILVIRGVMGTKKTVVFSALVVVLATFSGFVYGALF